jgi:hypothetical protein
MAKPSAPTARGCPNSCTQPSIGLQRPITEPEFAHLSQAARTAVHKSQGRCFVCSGCGLVYIRQPALDMRLGRLVYNGPEPGWTFEQHSTEG